jgi:hypothetical protein
MEAEAKAESRPVSGRRIGGVEARWMQREAIVSVPPPPKNDCVAVHFFWPLLCPRVLAWDLGPTTRVTLKEATRNSH